MFELNCRFQIAALLVLLIIVVDYTKNPHLKLRSSRYFITLMALTGINLVLDLMTVYTITHLTEETAAINRLFHQFFIASVILTLLMEYLYIRSLSSNQRHMTLKEFVKIVLPILVSAVVIFHGKLEYHVDDMAAYSYGPMAITVYVCGFIYLLMGLRTTFSKKGLMTATQKASVVLGFGIWIDIMIIQIIFPNLLLSGLGFVLLVLAIYFSHENQKENYDADTDSFNRNAFTKMLIENYSRKRPLYIISLTCDNLDKINRIAGHDSANNALLYLKNALAKYTGQNVYHSRYKQFSIFLLKDITPFMGKLQALEAELAREEYAEFRLSCHISVMDLRKYTTTWCQVDGLMDFMAQKLDHTSCKICFLNDDIVSEKKRKEQIELLLDEAIEKDGFEMFFQPIYNSEKKDFTSAEALIRFKDTGSLGFVSPEEFIPMAEEKGLILDIGDRALSLVAQFAAKYNLPASRLEYIEVNLSAIQAVVPKLDQRLKAITDKFQIPASFINLEITETATVNFGVTFDRNITRLRELGFSFSMDDFGTGYSNLAQMNKISYDLVKLDKSLIWPAFDDNGQQAEILLSSVIHLLQAIGVKIVAEGVETQEMVDYLINKKVEYLQGYYYSRPVPEDKFISFMREHNGLEQE